MITSFAAKPWVTLEESTSANSERLSERTALVTALLEKGFPIKLSATKKSGASQSISGLVLQRRPMTATGEPQNLVPLTATPADSAPVSVVDISELDNERVVAEVENYLMATVDRASVARKWKPWFPVIDFNRCTNCMQCLSFCLFDVYGVTEDKQITVQNEDNCKTDCPACSRVCPEVAIMFPKYKAGPINGDEVSMDDVRREGMKVDISALLGGDIYSMLRDRSEKAKSRFSAERDEERALKERKRCLDKLKTLMSDLDIPAEVLSSLPNDEQIKAKADAAQNKPLP